MKYLVCSLLAILAQFTQFSAFAEDAPVDHSRPINAVVLVLDGEIQGFIFVSAAGDVTGVKAEDCAAAPECVAEIQRLKDTDHIGVIRLHSKPGEPV